MPQTQNSGQALAGVASKWVLGEVGSNAVSDALDEANKDVGEFAERQMRQKLDAYEEEKRTAQAFKEAIGKLTGSLTNPIVVFVDELDRCRPDFAIKTLERIKHFFEVPGLIFVLLVNAKQLAASVRGAYGDDIDAETYLRKFILFSVALPKDRSRSTNSSDISYCRKTLSRYGFPETESVNSFAEQFGSLATSLHLQYRDIERGCAMFAIGQPIDSNGTLVAWAIALKLWKPTLFERVVNGEKNAHAEVLASKEVFGTSFIVPIAMELHRVAASGYTAEMAPEIKKHLWHLLPYLRDERHVFTFLGEKIGVSVR